MDSRLFVWLLVILHSFVNLSSADPHDILQKALLNNSHELCLEKAITAKPEFQFHEVFGESLEFKVRTEYDAHIALTTGPAESEMMYEIIIGGWDNTKSVIRKIKPKAEYVKTAKTPNILNKDKLMGFWIRWKRGVIEVGQQCEADPFMSYEDPKAFGFTHYGIYSGCNNHYLTGKWDLKAITNELQYQFHEVSGESLQFKVEAASDAHIALTTGPAESEMMYEIIIGGWYNTMSYIRKVSANPQYVVNETTPNRINNDKLMDFWIRWKRGVIEVGQHCKADPFMSYEDPKAVGFTHYGIRTAWKSNEILMASGPYIATGEWDLEAITSPPKFEYQFREVSGESLQFKVKAANDAIIALTTGPAESKRMYEIIIGGWNNTESAIRKNKQLAYVVRVETPNILNRYKQLAFWIRWNGGVIAVGRQGEAEPFMSWEDPKPFVVTHYGISTRWGATGEWVIEGSCTRGTNRIF